MSKKQKKRNYDNSQRQEDNIAGACNMCPNLIARAKPARQQRTRVYAKRGEVRYCICDNCGNTWKRIP